MAYENELGSKIRALLPRAQEGVIVETPEAQAFREAIQSSKARSQGREASAYADAMAVALVYQELDRPQQLAMLDLITALKETPRRWPSREEASAWLDSRVQFHRLETAEGYTA